MSLKSSQLGFTLVEMIVSLAVFSIVVTISIGALLSLIATNGQLQSERSVMTNLSFALDSMTREIRTGTRYVCGSVSSRNGSLGGGPNRQIFRDNEDSPTNFFIDCPLGRTNKIHGISFVESGNSITGVNDARIVYFFDQDQNKIYRRLDNGESRSIVSSGIYIVDAEFYVTGGDTLTNGNVVQPSVTVFIKARETADVTDKEYYIQTTVVQRILDI